MDFFEQREIKTQWFMNARFGMFIHFGLYAIPGRGEWIMSYEEISRKEYSKYFEEFNPSSFDAVKWAKAAKNAGMKYAVLTAKHHEGFCLFDSKFTDYKSTNTAFGRDLVKEYTEAFRAEGLKVGLYYSLLDWHHKDYPAYGDKYHPERNNEECKDTAFDFNNYVTYMHGQVKELMSNYGKIDILWFDFSYDELSGEAWRGSELIKMISSLQPDIIINGRLEGSGEHYGSIMTDNPSVFSGDFACPEMLIPPQGLKTPSGRKIPWEACFTLDNNWGYCPTDRNRKTSAQIIRKLVECVSKNGNMLINVSPDAKGNIPQWQLDVLSSVGDWVSQNGESIYNCCMSPFEKPEWGRYTINGNKLYAHVLESSIGAIALPGIKGRLKKARRLSDGFEMLILDPWTAKEFPDYEFINFSTPDCFTFDMGESPDMVIELELL